MAAPPVAFSAKKKIHKLLKNHSDKELEKVGTMLQIVTTKTKKIIELGEEVITLKGGLMELDQLSFIRNAERDALLTCEGWSGQLIQFEQSKQVRAMEVAVEGGKLVEAP